MSIKFKNYMVIGALICLAATTSCQLMNRSAKDKAPAETVVNTDPCNGEPTLKLFRFDQNTDTVLTWLEDTMRAKLASDQPLSIQADFIINTQEEYEQLKQNWKYRSIAGKERSAFPAIDFDKSTLIAYKVLAPTYSFADDVELKKSCPGFELHVGVRPPAVSGSAYTKANYYAIVPKLPTTAKVSLVSYAK
jgi:hypothetical protein